MIVLGTVLFLLSLVAILASGIAIIHPWHSRLFPTRKRATVIFAASIIVLVASPVLFGSSQETNKPPQSSVASVPADVVPSATGDPPTDHTDLAAETKTLWQETVDITKNCEIAAGYVSKQSGKSFNVYKLHPLAKQANEICTAAGREVGHLQVSPSSRDVIRDTFQDAIETCAGAYILRGTGYRKIQAVVNGEVRPSDVSDATEAMKKGNLAGLICAESYMQAVLKAGLPPDTIVASK